MILCKYVDMHGIDILMHMRLKASNPMTFNDPFELLPGVDSSGFNTIDIKRRFKKKEELDDLYRKAKDDESFQGNKRDFKNHIKKYFRNGKSKHLESDIPAHILKTLEKQKAADCEWIRVLCFSDPNSILAHDDILLWAHYARHHYGLRIHFDKSKIDLKSSYFKKVDYATNRPVINMKEISRDISHADGTFESYLYTKSAAWRYECEYRWLFDKCECVEETESDGISQEFVKISEKAIVQIDIGVKCHREDQERVLNIARSKAFSHVKIKKAELHSCGYRLIYNDVKR